jgi:hypothetical protein
MESELSAASTALRLSTSIKAVVDDAFIDSTTSSSSSSSSTSSSIRASKAVEEQPKSSLLQLYHSNRSVVDEVVKRLQQRPEMKDDVDDDDDDARKRKQVTWVELVHGGLPIDDDGDDSESKEKVLDASPSCTSEKLQVFDRWIERIHNAAQTGTFMMVITQGSLQPAKLLAAQKLRSRWEQAAIRRKQALAGMLTMMIAAVMIMMACW